MVYSYDMWDLDGHEISEGLYETGARPTTTAGRDVVPIELKGRMFALDADDLLLKAHSFFRKKYGQEQGDDFYLRWASILTFCREQAEPLSRHGVVQVINGVMAGIDANFARMLLDSYSPSPLYGGFPTSPLHEGESGFGLGRTLDAWLSGKYFSPVEEDSPEG